MSALLKTATKWEKAKCSPATSEWRNNGISMQWCMITKEKKKKKRLISATGMNLKSTMLS